MKQYRITSKSFNVPGDDDCYLSPNDPMYDLCYNGDAETIDTADQAKLETNSTQIVDGSSMGKGIIVGLDR